MGEKDLPITKAELAAGIETARQAGVIEGAALAIGWLMGETLKRQEEGKTFDEAELEPLFERMRKELGLPHGD